ncbi:unnamed protein product [Acanthoscelides obtectus]|uniref:Uncharacterized protein n=1 Tax=Acanthoscelides obtectus TaxID=200917 RepID=A0A9P0LW67_ACAOB|nr:unnamed protein product [Acanthoscelides obtectus]CAK1651368.1 hypothetical protein AOBTE_LOCUS17226 [Acanthoscelides obtectus]
MFKVTRKLKVTLQGCSETQGHVSRSHFKVTFQGWHRRSALKVVWHRRSALKGVPEHTNPIYCICKSILPSKYLQSTEVISA